jgi:DNA-binding CsgD family transcriptional regulator
MPARKDKLLEAIEAVHAAGLEEELWPNALGRATELLGANCATLETLEVPSLRHLAFLGFNTPPAAQLLYLQEFVPLSPRTRFAALRRAGELLWDYKVLDEAAMDCDPFYQGFLRQVELRYFYGGVLEHDGREMTAVTFNRARKQGHVERSEIALMQLLMPHFRQAFGVTQRLREQRNKVSALQSALDWLADGVALLAADGTVLYANEALQEIARRNDGVAITRRAIRLASATAAAHLANALGAVSRLRGGDPTGVIHDFSMARRSPVPPYFLSVRPVTHADGVRVSRRMAVALLFVHDPLARHRRAAEIFRESLGLTEAEANLALALQEGMAVTDYARARKLSLNTAYTHLRRIKEKTGCKHMAELIRWLNDLHLPLRREQ